MDERLESTYTVNQTMLRISKILEDQYEERGHRFFFTAEDVRRSWSKFLEGKLEPCPWVAMIIKASNSPAQDGVQYVDVVQVDWTQLKAKVELLKDETEEPPEALEVNLANLIPVPLGGEDTNQETHSKAKEALDDFRFFKDFLWFPWDEDDDGDDVTDNWINEHLMMRWMVLDGHDDAFIVLKKLARSYNKLKEDLDDAELAANLVVSLRLRQQLDGIAKRAAIVENVELYPEFLKQRRLEKDEMRAYDRTRGYSIDRQAVMVWNGGSSALLTDFFAKASKLIPFDNAHIVIKDKLQDAIDCCVPGDVILLGGGEHLLEDLGDLNTCLSIFGVDGREKTKIILNSGHGFEVIVRGIGSTCHLENVTLSSQNGLGGIWVRKGACLTIKDCRMNNFTTAIKISEESKATLKWSEIDGCQCGAEIDASSTLCATGGLIEDCQTGFLVESNDLQMPNGVTLNEVDNYATNKIEIVKPQVRITIDRPMEEEEEAGSENS